MTFFKIVLTFMLTTSLALTASKQSCFKHYQQVSQFTLKAKDNLTKFELVFQRGRGLYSYISALGKDFKTKLLEIENKEQAHWLDAGGGEGNALYQFHQMNPKSSVTSTLVSLESFAEPTEKLKVLKGRYIEHIPANELTKSDLITDVFGPMAYSSEPHKVLAKYLEVLKPDGEIHIFLGSKEEIFGKNNKFITSNNEILDFIDWLQSIQGLEITARKETREDDMNPFEVWSVKIKKQTFKNIEIPELQARSFKAGAPPEFLFQETRNLSPLSPLAKQQQQALIVNNLQQRLLNLNLTSFFDQFRSGELTHPLLKIANSLKINDSWLNFSSTENTLATDLVNKNFDYSDRSIFWGISQKWMELRSSFLKPENWNYQEITQLTEQTKKAELITDFYGPFQTSLEPDKVLTRYLHLAKNKSPVFIHLGKEYTGFGALSEVILKSGEKVSLRRWLMNIPNLNIRFYRGGYAWSGGQWTFVKIINSKPGIKIPPLKVLGIGKSTNNEVPKIIFEEI